MCDALVWSFNALAGLPWLEFIELTASVGTVVIAFLALKNWKEQERAKRQAEFLDQLMEASYAYISEMSKPVAIVRFIRMAMACHAPTWEAGDQSVKGAIAYIEKSGVEAAKSLDTALQAVQSGVIRLRSLSAKGQVFRFEDYAKCQNAVIKLTWQYGRLDALAACIGLPSLNWSNPEVLSSLNSVMQIDADDILKSFEEDSVAIMEFIKYTYGRIYG
jgi:hypothetical protein